MLNRQPRGKRVATSRRFVFGPNELTDNEVAWVEFLRMIDNGRDLRPTFRRVQLLRRVCGMKWIIWGDSTKSLKRSRKAGEAGFRSVSNDCSQEMRY